MATVRSDRAPGRTWDDILREQWVAALGLPPRVAHAVSSGRDEHGTMLRTTPTSRALYLAQQANLRWRFLVLTGAPGTGKTIAMARWLVWSFSSPDHYARWVSAVELSKMQGWMRTRENLLWVPDLAVDDAGAEDERGAAAVGEVLWYRYENSKRTIVTTNLSVAEFDRRYGEKISSRLGEVGAWIETETVVRIDRTRGD